MGTILVDEELETRTVQQDIADALALIERANAKLRPDELSRSEAHSLLDAYGRIVKLGGFGVASLSPTLGNVGGGRSCLRHLDGQGPGDRGDRHCPFRLRPISTRPCGRGLSSLDQAAEYPRAEEAAPGSARSLVKVAQERGVPRTTRTGRGR